MKWISNKYTFFIIAVMILAVTIISFYGCSFLGIKGVSDIRFGIDIRGGVEAIYTAKDLDRLPTANELESVRAILETRLDSNNILDREITIDKINGEILVRFPWKSGETDFDPKAAIAELGETALLTFRDPEGNVLLEGKNVLGNSEAGYDQSTRMYSVQIQFDETGAKLFEEATEQLIGKSMAIYMDETMISEPTVNEKIDGGHAIITHIRTQEEAQDLSIKINAGALPFSLETKNFNTISPTLGFGALKVMIYAGLIAFSLVCLFMIAYYRIPGFVACFGLTLQVAMQMLLLSIPQITLTLPGIAGIILSMGMGVDTNIIISERIKEELALGKSIRVAIKTGYHRAFSAILDGNLTTAIVAIVLMIFGSGSMLSFGYTLIMGVLLNFISGITVSKLMVSSLSLYSSLKSNFLYGLRRNKAL